MKLMVDFRKMGQAAFLLLFFALLLNNQLYQGLNDSNKKSEKGYFISAAKNLCGFMTDDDHTNPADNEEDEDEDDDENENRAESVDSKSCQEFIISNSYHIRQDRLFCDPHGELVSPPPKI